MADYIINYPYRVFRYKVEIAGLTRAGFSEVSGMNLSVDPIEYREGNDLRNTPRKLAGLTKFGNVSFKWGTTNDQEFLEWIYSVAPDNTAGPKGMVRKNITVTLISDNGTDGPTWELINCWPVGYNVPDLSGLGGDVAIESLEVCCEGMTRIKEGAAAGEPSPN